MDDVTLAELQHENLISTYSLGGAQMAGSLIERRDGIALLVTGHPIRLFNQVLIDGDPVARPEALVAALAAARARGVEFIVSLRSGVDDRYRSVASEAGLVPVSDSPWMPGMALHPLPGRGLGTSPDLEIRRVDDAAGVADHVRVLAAGFGMPEEWVALIVTESLAAAADASLYVGYHGGTAVTSGFGYRTGRTIGVYNIATIPSAQRRGYGAAITMRMVDDGAAAGCDVAVLQSSDMGRPVYERLGFRTVVEYFGFVDPTSP